MDVCEPPRGTIGVCALVRNPAIRCVACAQQSRVPELDMERECDVVHRVNPRDEEWPLSWSRVVNGPRDRSHDGQNWPGEARHPSLCCHGP